MKWTINKTIPTMAVPDLQAGIEYYERLGFAVDWRWPDASPTHAGLEIGECSIMLSLSDPACCADVYFIVDDIAACHATVMAGRAWELAAAAGALAKRANCPPPNALQAPAEPANQGYGLRDFSVTDPWGHYLTFGEVIRE